MIMQIPDEIRKCVAFVFREPADSDEQPRVVGAEFFIGLPLDR
jgi:hypothetical protein